MKILLYHWGYYGDIIVVGQNFAHELKSRYPNSKIDLMVRPRIRGIEDILHSLGIFENFLQGEKQDYEFKKRNYDKSFIIDDRIYPEGHLRTIFTHAGFEFRQHPLKLVFSDAHLKIASEIIKKGSTPTITTQDDIPRKWDETKANRLLGEISKVANLIVLGPNKIHPKVGRPLSFMESCAVISKSDLFFGIDSGIAHGAALSGTQTVLLPPIHPEFYISPTSYANPFISNKNRQHISIKPSAEDFCGNFLCLKRTSKGQLKRPSGVPSLVRCDWKKKFFFFKTESCYNQISVDAFYNQIASVLKTRKLK